MASEGWRTGAGLAQLLFETPFEFSFFQAVRLLARIRPSRSMVGADAMPSEEVVRFRAYQSMEFPASEVFNLAAPNDDALPAEMTVSFMGLTGPLGVLPWHYTEWLLSLGQKKPALQDFLDLFNHRMISHFYRAWEKHHFFVSYERTAEKAPSQMDEFTAYLFDLIGMGTAGLRGRLVFADQALLRYAGLIAQRPHSASALRSILRDYFRVPVEIQQFCGKWVRLDQHSLSRLGAEEPNNELGIGTIAGEDVWAPQASFRIRLGPMPLSRFSAFLPEGNAFRALQDWVLFFVGKTPEFELQLILAATEVPSCPLSDEGINAPRLGWTSWLKVENFLTDAGDLVFSASQGGLA